MFPAFGLWNVVFIYVFCRITDCFTYSLSLSLRFTPWFGSLAFVVAVACGMGLPCGGRVGWGGLISLIGVISLIGLMGDVPDKPNGLNGPYGKNGDGLFIIHSSFFIQ